MRVRMLNRPEVIRMLNSETVAMKINATEGFPFGLPALSFVERGFERVPFTRLNFSFYLLLDPRAERVIGGSGCRYEVAMELGPERVFTLLPAQLSAELESYRHSQKLMDDAGRDPAAAAMLAELERDRDRRLARELLCLHEPRLLVIFWLQDMHAMPWASVLELVRTGPLAAGVRNATVRALGELLCEERAYGPDAQVLIRSLFRFKLRQLPAEQAEAAEREWRDGPVPPLFLRRAAQSLVELAGAPPETEAGNVVEWAKSWWRTHRGDASRQVAWSEDPATRFAFVPSTQ